jgi:hypothetical protein
VASGIFGPEETARKIKPLGAFASLKITDAFPMRANYFTVELWYRGKLQFVRELENFDLLTDLNYRVGTLKEISTGWAGDGEAFFYHRGVSTFKDLLCVKPYPHKDKIVITSRYSRSEPFITEGYPELKRIIMNL